MYKIMIIEDDSGIIKAIKNHFDLWGYETTVVSDFREVLANFIEFDPQLVLMDISLPFFNGFYWCTEIRKGFQSPDYIYFFRFRYNEHYHGNEYGSR